MASVDSGVDTGNDSNDSFAQDKNSFTQNETQPSSISTETIAVSEACTIGHNQHCVKGRLVRFGGVDTAAGLRYLHVQGRHRCYEIQFEGVSSAYRNYNLINKLKCKKYRLTRNDSWQSGPLFTKSQLDEKRLRFAVCVSNVDEVRRILDAGVDPNCADYHFRTPLHISACNGDADTVRLLLERGADPNVKDMIGNTPLHLAVCTNHIDVVTLLLKAGTDASCYNVIGRSPLQLAQSKLKIIQRSQDHAFRHQVTSQVIEMLLTFIKKKTEVTKNAVDEELLNAFQSRLQVSETQEQVENELQNLLDNLSSLSLSNPQNAAITPSTSTAIELSTGST